MSTEPFAFAAAGLAVLCAVAGYALGRRTAYNSGKRDGLRIGGMGGKIIADMVAREWANRKQWPLSARENVQRWKELGRREAYANAADRLSRAFNIETPARETP
jgi:hypothetical protein